MILVPIVAVLALALSADQCAECRADARRTVLCATHADEEQTTLREERSVLARSKEPAERIAALERIARLTSAHANAPSPNVARILADSLHDDSIAVRRRALALLGADQHRDETVKGVIDGWRAAQKPWREMDERLTAIIGDPSKASTTTRQELEELPNYLDALIAALGRLHDERAHRELLAILRWPLDHTPGRFFTAAARAALGVDSRKGVEAVLEFTLMLEAEILASRVPARFGPRGGLLSALLKPLENAGPEHVEEILDCVHEFARRKQLPPTPAPALEAPAEWRAWFRGAKDQIADRLTLLE